MLWSNKPRPWSPFGWKAQRPSGSFSPLSLTNLRGWWRSDMGITIATGVSAWADQSGQGNTLVQGTGANQPTLTAGQINGRPALVFDGVNDSLAVSFALTQPTTVFIVFSQISWTNFDMVFDGGAVSNDMSLQQATASPGLAIRAGGAAAALNNNLAVGTFGLVTSIFDGASSLIQVNSTAATTGNPGTNAGAGLRVGVRGAGGANFGNISVAEIIVMAATATAAERVAVRSYSQALYNVGA